MIKDLPQSLIEVATKILQSSIRLEEMATPTKDIKDKVYYHGTYDRNGSDGVEVAKSIANNGIVPPKLSGKEHNFTPVENMAYTTPHLGYALMYAIGGDVAGAKNFKPKHSHGYIFVAKGNKLTDVQPDEDSVGQIFYNHQRYGNGPSFVSDLAMKHSDYNTRKKAKNGSYEHWAKLGKHIVPHMNDSQKLELIRDYGAHIANKGNIMPDRVYRIATDKIPHLERSGSNFFDHAEELDMDELRNGNIVKRRKRKPL